MDLAKVEIVTLAETSEQESIQIHPLDTYEDWNTPFHNNQKISSNLNSARSKVNRQKNLTLEEDSIKAELLQDLEKKSKNIAEEFLHEEQENSVIEKKQIQNLVFSFQKYKLLIIFSCIAFILVIINLVLLRRKLSP
jgi:hypothetical protein